MASTWDPGDTRDLTEPRPFLKEAPAFLLFFELLAAAAAAALHLGRVVLGHGRLFDERLPRLHQPRGVVGQQPRRLQLGGHLGHLVLQPLDRRPS